jgi:signal recognition particle GTPase
VVERHFYDKTVVNKPIKFVGTGKMDAIDVFYPIRMARTFWNGRCCLLVERAQEQFDEEEAEKSKKIAKMNLVLMISFSNSTSKENG